MVYRCEHCSNSFEAHGPPTGRVYCQGCLNDGKVATAPKWAWVLMFALALPVALITLPFRR